MHEAIPCEDLLATLVPPAITAGLGVNSAVLCLIFRYHPVVASQLDAAKHLEKMLLERYMSTLFAPSLEPGFLPLLTTAYVLSSQEVKSEPTSQQRGGGLSLACSVWP